MATTIDPAVPKRHQEEGASVMEIPRNSYPEKLRRLTCSHNVLLEEDDLAGMADYFYSSIVAREIECRRNDLNYSLHTKTSSPILYDYSSDFSSFIKTNIYT